MHIWGWTASRRGLARSPHVVHEISSCIVVHARLVVQQTINLGMSSRRDPVIHDDAFNLMHGPMPDGPLQGCRFVPFRPVEGVGLACDGHGVGIAADDGVAQDDSAQLRVEIPAHDFITALRTESDALLKVIEELMMPWPVAMTALIPS